MHTCLYYNNNLAHCRLPEITISLVHFKVVLDNQLFCYGKKDNVSPENTPWKHMKKAKAMHSSKEPEDPRGTEKARSLLWCHTVGCAGGFCLVYSLHVVTFPTAGWIPEKCCDNVSMVLVPAVQIISSLPHSPVCGLSHLDGALVSAVVHTIQAPAIH